MLFYGMTINRSSQIYWGCIMPSRIMFERLIKQFIVLRCQYVTPDNSVSDRMLHVFGTGSMVPCYSQKIRYDIYNVRIVLLLSTGNLNIIKGLLETNNIL